MVPAPPRLLVQPLEHAAGVGLSLVLRSSCCRRSARSTRGRRGRDLAAPGIPTSGSGRSSTRTDSSLFLTALQAGRPTGSMKERQCGRLCAATVLDATCLRRGGDEAPVTTNSDPQPMNSYLPRVDVGARQYHRAHPHSLEPR